MSTTWILVADRGRARIVALEAEGATLAELECFTNLDARRPARALERDRPPRVVESVGAQRHAIEPRTTPADKVSRRFARELAATLRVAHAARRFDRLMLVAPPRFLGMLGASLTGPVRASLADELARDLTGIAVADLPGHLPKAWFGPPPVTIEAAPRNARGRTRPPRRTSTTNAPRNLA